MQRVAIARALVNDPDILLADEPTGALDSETSVQVMEILKEVAKDKLVIMVTHNPELAELYSTRIVRLIDGLIVSDSMPYDPEKELSQTAETAPAEKKPSMSFLTALSLSLNNLMTKKGRTILTAFAGSIGIIGIALILSLSSGAQNYIDSMEEDTLTSYPITIQQASIDMTSMMGTMMGAHQQEEHEAGQIYSSSIMTQIMDSMMNQIAANDLKNFKQVLEEDGSEIAALCSEIRYSYPTEIGIYTTDAEGEPLQVNPVSVLDNIGMGAIASQMGMNNISVCTEISDNEDARARDYELLEGNWPKSYNEVVLVVNENYAITDYTLYALGLLNPESLEEALKAAQDDIAENGTLTQDIHIRQEDTTYSYQDMLGLNLKLLLPTDYYEKQPDGTWEDIREDEAALTTLVNDAESLHVVGVVRTLNDGGHEYGTIGYTSDLTEYVIGRVEGSAIMQQQKADSETDVFTGLPFADTEAAQALNAEMDTQPAAEVTPEQQALLEQTIAALPEMFQTQLSQLPPEQQAEALISNEVITQEDYDALGAGTSAKKLISDSTYEDNLNLLHAASLEEPSAINLYAANFEDKEAITDAIDAYNDKMTAAGEDEKVIQYTDYVGMLMSSVTDIVNMVSYVLIAFVGISLVVSSIMIGVITLISVQERTKEIGILRSIGASKRDVSRVFNAETLIIGLAAGLLGIGVTMLLNIPINLIIDHLAGVDDVAQLPVGGAVILVAISVVLTLIAGLIPAKTAAKKDPVEALRTE